MPVPATKWSGTTTGLNFGSGATLTMATGSTLTLGSIVVDGVTNSDILMLGALVGVCNDASPSTVPTGGVVMYFSGGNLIAKRQSDSKTSTMTASWA